MADSTSKQFVPLAGSRASAGKQTQSATKKASNNIVGPARKAAGEDDLTKMKTMQNNYMSFDTGKGEGVGALNLMTHNQLANTSEIHRIQKG